MQFDAFLGRVQHELELPSGGHALRAIRATLTTLGERLTAGEAADLAASLPMEIDRYLVEAEGVERFGFDEFVGRVAEREGVERSDAAYHAKRIVAVVGSVTPPGELEQVRGQLPDEFDPLFEFTDSVEQ